MGHDTLFLVPVAFLLGFFSFLSVAFWSINRRRERESFYDNETARKIAEAHGPQAVLDFMREGDKLRTRRTLGVLTVGGVFAACGGAGLMAFMWAVEDMREEHIYFVALMPLLVGLGLIVYSWLFMPKN